MARYTVTAEGWLDGNYRKQGEVIELSDAEAKWLLRGGQITMADTDRPTDTPAEDAGGRKRNKKGE